MLTILIERPCFGDEIWVEDHLSKLKSAYKTSKYRELFRSYIDEHFSSQKDILYNYLNSDDFTGTLTSDYMFAKNLDKLDELMDFGYGNINPDDLDYLAVLTSIDKANSSKSPFEIAQQEDPSNAPLTTKMTIITDVPKTTLGDLYSALFFIPLLLRYHQDLKISWILIHTSTHPLPNLPVLKNLTYKEASSFKEAESNYRELLKTSDSIFIYPRADRIKDSDFALIINSEFYKYLKIPLLWLTDYSDSTDRPTIYLPHTKGFVSGLGKNEVGIYFNPESEYLTYDDTLRAILPADDYLQITQEKNILLFFGYFNTSYEEDTVNKWTPKTFIILCEKIAQARNKPALIITNVTSSPGQIKLVHQEGNPIYIFNPFPIAHPVMLSLMKYADSPLGGTGACSFSEILSVALEKPLVFLYQIMDWKQEHFSNFIKQIQTIWGENSALEEFMTKVQKGDLNILDYFVSDENLKTLEIQLQTVAKHLFENNNIEKNFIRHFGSLLRSLNSHKLNIANALFSVKHYTLNLIFYARKNDDILKFLMEIQDFFAYLTKYTPPHQRMTWVLFFVTTSYSRSRYQLKNFIGEEDSFESILETIFDKKLSYDLKFINFDQKESLILNLISFFYKNTPMNEKLLRLKDFLDLANSKINSSNLRDLKTTLKNFLDLQETHLFLKDHPKIQKILNANSDPECTLSALGKTAREILDSEKLSAKQIHSSDALTQKKTKEETLERDAMKLFQNNIDSLKRLHKHINLPQNFLEKGKQYIKRSKSSNTVKNVLFSYLEPKLSQAISHFKSIDPETMTNQELIQTSIVLSDVLGAFKNLVELIQAMEIKQKPAIGFFDNSIKTTLDSFFSQNLHYDSFQMMGNSLGLSEEFTSQLYNSMIKLKTCWSDISKSALPSPNLD